jgi:putative ABC transport system substrate-binding protein
MRRRALLVAGGASLLAVAARSFAQAPKLRRIAVLLPGKPAGYRSRFETFRTELRMLGQVEGRDVSIEARYAEDKTEKLESLAAELVALGPAVIFTATSAAIAACRKETSTIPIVFATAANPVEQGFVASLQHPGGNVTGILTHLLSAKMVEIAREALPQAKRLAILVHEIDPAHKAMVDLFVPTARNLKFDPLVVRVARANELGRAFDEMARHKTDALYLAELAFSTSNRRDIVDRSLKARLPLFSTNQETASAGGLLSYGTSREESFRRAAALVDKILRGAKPGDLAVEQPERFELIVNLKTAKAIGVTLSPTTMLRATKVIE